jgi:hypothetical protein
MPVNPNAGSREFFEERSVAAAFRLRGDKLKGCRLITRIWYAQPLGCMVINRQAFWPTTPRLKPAPTNCAVANPKLFGSHGHSGSRSL